MIAAVLAAAGLLSAQPVDAGRPESDPPDTARSVELSRVFPFWKDYRALPHDERDAFFLVYRFRTMTKPPEGGEWRFWTDTGDGPQRLTLDATGAAIPPEGATFGPQERLITDAPDGGVAVSMALSPAGELRRIYSVAELERATAQANTAIRSMMGLRALITPRLDTLQFVFEGAAPDAVLITEGGEQREVMTVYENIVTFKPWIRANRDVVEIRFGDAPVSVTLEAGR